MKKIKVMVTAAGGFGHGSSIVNALLLATVPLDILVTDMSPRLITSSPVLKREVVPSTNDAGYIKRIIQLLRKHKIDCLFTGSEQELIRINQYRKEIEAQNVKVFLNNTKTILLCKNKFTCNKVLASFGIPAPKTILIRKQAETLKVDFFPAVIKPYLETGASANVFVAENRRDLIFIVTYLLNKKIDIIVQEYLAFEDNEFTVGVTSLMEKPKVVASISMRRFIEGPSQHIRNGKIVISSGLSQGEFKDYGLVRKQCERIAEAVGSTGPLNIQLRLVDGKVTPFEINPRFSGTTSARALNGYNEPEFYIRKYVLNDPGASDSLKNIRQGMVVKRFEEVYYKYKKR